jgi:hypothetical protein
MYAPAVGMLPRVEKSTKAFVEKPKRLAWQAFTV